MLLSVDPALICKPLCIFMAGTSLLLLVEKEQILA